jgi:transposase-like protein
MSESGKRRRSFPDAFKLEAVAAIQGGRSVAQVDTSKNPLAFERAA